SGLRWRSLIVAVCQRGQRLLQPVRIIHFNRKLPGGNRHQWSIQRERGVTSQRRGNIVNQAHARLGFEAIQLREKLWVPLRREGDKFRGNGARILHNKGHRKVGIWRNKANRTDGPRASQPRSNTLPVAGEGERSAGLRSSRHVAPLQNKVLNIRKSGRWPCGSSYGFWTDLFHVRGQ